MKIVKELTLYVLLFMLVWILGSIWNVSNAQEVTAGEGHEEIAMVDLQIMRNQLIRESVSEEITSNYEELKTKELEEMRAIYEEEQRKIAEEKARKEAEEKAKKEAEEKARKEAEAKAKAESIAKAKAESIANAREVKVREERVRKVENKKEIQHIKQAEQQQKTIYVTTTAYTSGCNGCTGITASGYNVKNTIYYQGMRVIAADTSVLPIKTVVEIEGIGKAVVLDRGGAIKGNKIDVLFSNKNEAYSYGRKHSVKLTVIGKVK